MGYGYKDWVGVFYPHEARPAEFLQHYTRIFNTVELDTTFYGIPDRSRVRAWCRQTPLDFCFCLKTPREITHSLPLEQNLSKMEAFLDSVQEFGGRLGAVLLQFPPDFDDRQLPSLAGFLQALPRTVPFAVEFRNRSWDRDEARSLLKNFGIAWASTEYRYLPNRLHRTADFVYIRFIGRHGQYETKDRVRRDVSDVLLRWWAMLRPQLENLHTVYAFFNNDFSGHAPATCNAFKQLVGLPFTAPDVPQQGRLF